MQAKVYVTLKTGVLDPQGKAVAHALGTLGFNEVQDVRIGKYVEVTLPEMPKDKATARLKEMCEGLLANTVIESYRIEL